MVPSLLKQTSSKYKLRHCARNAAGSGIVEGAVGLMMIIGTTVVAVILLLNTGLATYYKEKIGYVADQAATYATSLNNADAKTRQAAISSFVSNLMTQKMGIKASKTSVKVADTVVGKWAAVSISISTEVPTLMSTGFTNLLPQQLQVSETAVALKVPYATQYLQGADPLGSRTVVLPLFNAPNGILPPDNLHAWQITLNDLIQLR